jgi:hypothetical protein
MFFTVAYRVAQIRTVFSVNKAAQAILFQTRPPPDYLAYVEWFTPFQCEPESRSGMYRVARSYLDNFRLVEIIPLTSIVQSIHLIPLPGETIPRNWTSNSVIEESHNFIVNTFSDRHTYILFNL